MKVNLTNEVNWPNVTLTLSTDMSTAQEILNAALDIHARREDAKRVIEQAKERRRQAAINAAMTAALEGRDRAKVGTWFPNNR